jgi:hypothetical protein
MESLGAGARLRRPATRRTAAPTLATRPSALKTRQARLRRDRRRRCVQLVAADMGVAVHGRQIGVA